MEESAKTESVSKDDQDVSLETPKNDDAEVWESEDGESSNKNDDAEVWEDDEGVSPEDNAEVWEDDKDYSEEEKPKSVKDKLKSIFGHSHLQEDNEKDGDEGGASSVLAGLKFTKDLGKDSELEQELPDDNDKAEPEDIVDLGSDDDYIYVDHSNDDVSEEEDSHIKFDKKIDEPIEDIVDEPVKESEDIPVKEPVDEPVREEVIEEPEDIPVDEPVRAQAVEDSIDDKVDLGSDDDYIYVDHSNDEPVREEVVKEVNDEPVDEPIYEEVDESVDESVREEAVEDSIDDKVDLGSDDDYIYVDHSNDEPDDDGEPQVSDERNSDNEISSEPVETHHGPNRNTFVKSRISDVVMGESKLKPQEVKRVKGEFIEDDELPLHKPAPKDEFVVDAEIVNDDDLNALNDDLHDWNQDDEELNIFNDNLPDWNNKDDSNDVSNIVNDAKNDYIDETFDDIEIDGDEKVFDLEDDEDYTQTAQDLNVERETPAADNMDILDDSESFDALEEDDNQESDEGVTYYQGSNDVTSKLRKNNLYYDDEKPRSVKDSIIGFKNDMKYINKSLKEIENPTKIDYVSVVDRTEEYDPADYLNMPSDDDSDKIIQREEELTFAEKEEMRIEREMKMETLQKEIESDENVIVPVHQQHRREELKDQALEDIIQSADEDYKEIEKERHKQDNQLKAFDNHKLPGKKKLEDNIVDYVESADIGLNSSDDLYKKPISDVADSVKLIVDIEGPIHVNEVTKRIKNSCHIKRAGANLKKTVNAAIETSENSGDIIRIGDFLYDASNNNVLIRRRNKPNIELISDEEISKSIELVLTYNPHISTKQVAKETSRNFGFKSTSKKTATRINGVLDLMIANNRVKIDNDYVELK